MHKESELETFFFCFLVVLQSYVTDLHNKMTGICLYGIVAHISREANLTDSVYYMTIKDITGAIMVKLHFLKSW